MLIVEDSPLYSAEFFALDDPYAYLADLRENHPVSIHRRADGYEFYALTRFDDVYAAYVDHVQPTRRTAGRTVQEARFERATEAQPLKDRALELLTQGGER